MTASNTTGQKQARAGGTDSREQTRLIQHLEALLNAQNRQAFTEIVEAIEWDTSFSPDMLSQVVSMALSLELVSFARRLAQQGYHLFPEHERLAYQSWVLEPPIVLSSPAARARELDKSVDWINKNATKYRGSWVAVHRGTLLGTAPTRLALHNQLTSAIDDPATLIYKV